MSTLTTDKAQSVRIGSQRPRIESVPDYEYTRSDAAVALMDRVGVELDEWQEYVLRGAMGERADGRYSAFEVCACVPRQNGKNIILEARELASLYLFQDEKLIIHSAHQFRTARSAFRSLEKRIRSSDLLFSQVAGYKGQGSKDDIRGIRTNGAEMSIELANGSRIDYQARSKGGGRGFTGDLIVLDEAYDLSTDEIAAMMPTMAARSMDGNPQIWYTSSAGMPDSEVLLSIRERGVAGDDARLAYYEWSAPDSAASDDEDAWYEANPSLGIRISEDYVRETEFASMGDEQFRRERLGILAQLGGDSKITDSEWSRILDPDSMPGEFASFAIDVPPDRASANVAVISRRADGVLHGQILDRRNGVSWVPDFLREIQQAWGSNATPVVIDAGSAAGSLIPELERMRVRLMYINAKQHGAACAQVYDDIIERRMVHRGQVELDEAVSNAKTKPLGDSAWKWAKTEATADISPLIALTLARHGWSTRGEKKQLAAERRVSGVAPRGRTAGHRSTARRAAGRRG